MKYFFHREAQAELDDAIEYYENCAAGLGYDFSLEVHAAIERILFYPKAWQILTQDIRRCVRLTDFLTAYCTLRKRQGFILLQL